MYRNSCYKDSLKTYIGNSYFRILITKQTQEKIYLLATKYVFSFTSYVYYLRCTAETETADQQIHLMECGI